MITSSSVRSVAKTVFLASVAPSAARASSTKIVFGVLFYSGSVFKISNKALFLIWLHFEMRNTRAVGGGVSQHHPLEGVWHGNQVTIPGGFEISKHVVCSTLVSACWLDKSCIFY